MCAPYFVNLNNNTFQLKMLLFIYVHSKREQKVVSNYRIYSVILRVAIISNVQIPKGPPSASTQADRRRLHSSMAWFTRDWFSSHHMVRCAHKSGDVINFITVACRISSWLKWYKNYKNRLRLAKVIVKNKMSRFYGSLCITVAQLCYSDTLNGPGGASSYLGHYNNYSLIDWLIE